MLRNSYYNHFDKTLQNERERCRRALARYNDLCRIDCALNPEQIREHLTMVFDPTKDNIHNFFSQTKERGKVSDDVKIEAPFRCSYGYNIKIQDGVYIGENCTIDDAGKVEIGPRTFIGSDVTIFTTDVAKDMVDRKGSGAPWIARPVHIAAEVVIGRGAKIHPGVRIEQGATVEPYAVVRETLHEFEIQHAAVGTRTA